METDGSLRLFNMATMSGVYPGVRTQRFQRLRLEPLPPANEAPCWAVVLWYDDPAACVVVRQNEADMNLATTPLLRIEPLQGVDFNAALVQGLADRGWQAAMCGACMHWAASTTFAADSLQAGTCLLRTGPVDQAPPPQKLAAQSHMALACPHYEQRTGISPAGVVAELNLAPLPRIAVTTESKLKLWQRWRLRVQRWLAPPPPAPSLSGQLSERSGVGAGTEPCFVCQGRIANLGALSVESLEGDKQTFSVWRCRECFTLYLSDWIDRWERVESLETEETIYRIAPAEAADLLELFLSIPDGDHPAGRGERTPQRDAILARLANRPALSHVVKQGR